MSQRAHVLCRYLITVDLPAALGLILSPLFAVFNGCRERPSVSSIHFVLSATLAVTFSCNFLFHCHLNYVSKSRVKTMGWFNYVSCPLCQLILLFSGEKVTQETSNFYSLQCFYFSQPFVPNVKMSLQFDRIHSVFRS